MLRAQRLGMEKEGVKREGVGREVGAVGRK
jgi:hypothetical protein